MQINRNRFLIHFNERALVMKCRNWILNNINISICFLYELLNSFFHNIQFDINLSLNQKMKTLHQTIGSSDSQDNFCWTLKLYADQCSFFLFQFHLAVSRVDFNMILRACHLIGHVKNSIAIQRLPFKMLIFGLIS